MDEHNLSSDSICSDDTEYLLGQNVSIRELDDFDFKSSTKFEQTDKTSPLKFNEVRQSPRRRNNSKIVQFPIDASAQRKEEKRKFQAYQKIQDSDLISYQEKGKVRHAASSYSTQLTHNGKELKHSSSQKLIPESSELPSMEWKDEFRKLSERDKHLQARTRTHLDEGRRTHEIIKQKEKELKSRTKQRKIYEDRVDLTRDRSNVAKQEAEFDQRKEGWRKKQSPGNYDNSWKSNKEESQEDSRIYSPEVPDIGSIASEATEDLLSRDDELDGSIIKKLKELNLAVNFDAESQELDDDKVKEGAQLLSKLFGGSLDNYYSYPSAQSGSASGQESSRGESQAEEKRNSISSKGSTTSFLNTESIQQTPEETTKNIPTRKAKVSFATDESISFNSSPRVRKVQTPEKAYEENYNRTYQQDTRYNDKSDGYGRFVRESSALRAAMDYEDDDDEDDDEDGDGDDRFKQKKSPVRSSDTYHAPEPNLAKYQTEKQQQQRQADLYCKEDQGEPSYSSGKPPNRSKDERISVNGSGRPKGDATDGEPQWDGFYTSTPQKNAQATGSPGTNRKVDSSDIERKLYLEKKDKLNKSSKELLEFQFEVDQVLMKKKVALEEVQVLEDKLRRNKAEIKTSENLSEQYRQQVTKTRSELMDLEVERDSARQDIKEMEDMLIKQKQEVNEVFKVERKSERKVLELSLDNNKLQRVVEILKAKLDQSELSLANEKKLHQEKMEMLQEQLHDGQRAAQDSIQRLKKQLEDERQNVRSSHYERIQSTQKFQDDSKEMQEKEIEAVKTRLTRENEAHLEKQQEKSKREIDALARTIQDGEFRISQLVSSLKEKEREVDTLKTKVLEEKQKAYDGDTTLQQENTKLQNYAKALKAEVDSLRQREANLSASNRTLEQSYDEKVQETRRLQEKIQNQLDESSKLQENKVDELQMLRSLVRQQEDATRLLGEKLRSEAQEQIRSALQRERQTIDKEREKQREKLEEIKNSYEDILKQVRVELEEGRIGHHQLQSAALKMRKEIEKLREKNLLAQEEKVNAVAQLRSESREQIIKLKDKIQELALVTNRNEKDIVLEINEECRRVAAVIGGSPNTTPIKSNGLSSSFTGSISGRESPGSSTNSPARDALTNLKSCNAELRQHLIEAKREMEYHKNDTLGKQQPNNSELTHQQISLFKKALKSKDEEIARLKRQLQEDTNKSMVQFKSERAIMQKTIDRLEKDLRETKKLIPSSSPIVNGHSSFENTSTSGMGTSVSSCASPRTGEDSSTTRLLRHLQGRVQQLRAQNDSLRSDSLNESQSSVGTVDSTYVDGAEDQSRKLHTALQLSDQRANRNAAMLSQKMLEMTKLQKMLTHATKENMKLERAYASLQKTVIDTSN